jgi:anti-sigma B factor antagonist
VELTITDVVDTGDKRSLSLVGSIDLSTRDDVVKAATAALAAGGGSALTIDMSGVTFMDSTGIGAIVEISNEARRAKVAFTLEQPSSRVRRILELTGLLDAWSGTDATPSLEPS